VIVDAVDEPSRAGKEGIFSHLMARHELAREDVLVVGDNVESELAAARRLGVPSVQTLRPGVTPAPDVRLRVANLRELEGLVRHWPAEHE
jgi:putative hydrolase of the HAD superfamily